MTSLEKIKETTKILSECGIEDSAVDAELLVRAGLDIDSLTLYRDDPKINDKQNAIIDRMVARRCRREPLQYIIGHLDFMGLRLIVGEGVLIPRPETELMAEHAIKVIGQQIRDNRTEIRILDLCTGSGCLAISLASEFKNAEVTGIDISDQALVYARKNAELNSAGNISFLRGHLFEPLGSGKPGRSFDLIISNPPYIISEEIELLQPEIRDWEPLGALDGGPDGLDFYREIVDQAQVFLKWDGIIMFELGAGYAGGVSGMLEKSGYSKINVIKDLSGIDRIIEARWTR